MTGDKKFASSSLETKDILAYIGLSGDRQKNIDKVFKGAYTAKDQPDVDGNGLGDYAERAKKIQEAMAGLPKEARYFIAMNPGNLLYEKLSGLKKTEDFTEENTDRALYAIENLEGVVTKSPDLRGEYTTWAQGKINEEWVLDRDQDEVVRLLLARGSDKVLEKIMPLIARYTNYGKAGDNISGSELNDIYGILSRDKDTEEDMGWANDTNKRFNSVINKTPTGRQGEEARKQIEDHRYMLPIDKLEGLFSEAQTTDSADGQTITKDEMTKILEGINALIAAVKEDKIVIQTTN